MEPIPDDKLDLFEKPAIATIATMLNTSQSLLAERPAC